MNQKQMLTMGATLGCLLAISWSPAALAGQNTGPELHDHNQKAAVCYFDTIKYTNKGSYVVQGLNLYYVDSQGQVRRYYWNNSSHLQKNVPEGGNMTVKLDNVAGIVRGLGDKPPLRDRQEVWPQVSIIFGDVKDCHKHGHKLVYAKGSNRTIHFMSAGSTTKNNSCKYAENIANQCNSSVPPTAQ